MECKRVQDAVEALKAGDLVELGRLLNESHYSLRDLYEVTGRELDTLSALLTQDSTPPVVIRQAGYIPSSYSAFRVSAWISQVAGIRAGPQRLS